MIKRNFIDRAVAVLPVWLKRFESWRGKLAISKIPKLNKVYAIFKNSPESRWIISEADAIRLYKLVRKSKPKKVLDLGTGIGASSAVIALALKENNNGGAVVSIEQFEKCVNIASDLLERAGLKKYVKIIKADPKVFKIEKISKYHYFAGYQWEPDKGEKFDLVLIDGPGSWVQEEEFILLDSGDIINLLPSIKEGALVYFDGRGSSASTLLRYLGHYFEVMERKAEYTLLKRNNLLFKSLEDAIVKDSQLKRAEREGYNE